MSTLYKIREPQIPFGVFSMQELMECKFFFELWDSDPEPKLLIHGEWYCEGSDCAVREVRINARWPDGDRPKTPRFECPACGGMLKFHGHLAETVLIPVD